MSRSKLRVVKKIKRLTKDELAFGNIDQITFDFIEWMADADKNKRSMVNDKRFRIMEMDSVTKTKND